jgi:hypothetical protein
MDTKLYIGKKSSYIVYTIPFRHNFAKNCVCKGSKYVYSKLDMF